MKIIDIEAAPRDTGKGAARAVRRSGNVPCVVYGKHVDSVPLQVGETALKPLIFTTEASLVRLEADGEAWRCILKDIDFHPVTDRPIHADFQVLQEGEEITLTVPVRYLGIPAGQKDGGYTQYVFNELTVRCLPKDIPSHIEVEVEELAIGDSIHIGDLEIEGVEFVDEPGRTLVTVVPPRALVEEEEEELVPGVEVEGEEAPVEGEAPEEGEEEGEAEEEE